jgi:UDP-N-acetylmuramoyl-tripeptide--D-alanyl-D-alanine ligase
LILVKDTIKALGDIAHFHRGRFSIPVIAITGSNGKTTAKDMVCFILEAKFCVLKNEGTQNNQIGLPMTLLRLNKNHDIAVLEMGTNHFGEIRYLSQIAAPNIGIILNIGPSHLEFFGDLSGVFKEKYELIENLKFPYIGILNDDDPFLITLLKNNKDRFLIGFGIKNKSDFQAQDISMVGKGLIFQLKENKFRLDTLGVFNVYNALAAVALTRLFGLDYSLIVSRLKRFKFPEGRLRLRKINNRIFIDDTYNSNPASLREAVTALKNIKTRAKKIAVIGDMLELGRLGQKFHIKAGKTMSEICDIIITVGKLSRQTALAAENCGFKSSSIFVCRSSKEARDILFNVIKPKHHDVILVKGSRLMKMEEVFKK